MGRLPDRRPPTHPGEMLLEEFIKPHGLTQKATAAGLGISFVRLNEIVRARRGVTPDTALRLERFFGMDAEFWLNLQRDWDLWQTIHSAAARQIEELTPFSELART